MNYASLDEIYKESSLQVKKNQYEDIIKNITSSNKKSVTKRDLYNYGEQPESNLYATYKKQPASKNLYSTYNRPENFNNNLEQQQQQVQYIESQLDNSSNQREHETITLDTDNNENDCLKFLDHLSKCKKCRDFIIKKFNLTEQDDPSIKRKDEMLDMAIYILTGVFILFILDSFISLGKYIKR